MFGFSGVFGGAPVTSSQSSPSLVVGVPEVVYSLSDGEVVFSLSKEGVVDDPSSQSSVVVESLGT